jgi:RNA polymerase sigma-70 factor (TIGR02943 family)
MAPQPALSPLSNPDRWVDTYADALFRYALTRLRRRQDAEDAVQETLLAALQGHRQFRGDSAELTWLIGILRNKVVDRIRLATRETQVNLVDDVGETVDEWSGTTDHWLRAPKAWRGDPTKLVENGEFWDQVRKCFAGLPERQAQVFALRTFDELEAEDICQQTGLTAANLWVLLHRARGSLRACLEGSWFAPEAKP